MPELPEVEVVRQGLERGVVGRTIDTVEVRHPRAIRRHTAGSADFIALLTGRTITAAKRRGKFLWLPLDSGDALTGHLGMSGQLLVVPPDKPEEKHLRVRLTFHDGDAGAGAAGAAPARPGGGPDTGAPPARPGGGPDVGASPAPLAGGGRGRELRFVDQRTFGGLLVVAGGADLPHTMSHIARDPLDPEFDDAAFRAALKRKRTGIKRALLDQTLISGVGNIYADEALWRARLHYARPTEGITRPQADGLLAAVRDVLTESLAAGGTSFDALYVSTEGVSGLFERSLAVYGRENEPCLRDGTPIRRDSFMNRSSFTCPKCQVRPRNGSW